MLKRRTVVRSISAGVATSAALWAEHRMGLPTLAQDRPQNPSELSNHTFQWALLYWMPYDNDLARFGESILGMLTRGTHGSDVVVVANPIRKSGTILRDPTDHPDLTPCPP